MFFSSQLSTQSFFHKDLFHISCFLAFHFVLFHIKICHNILNWVPFIFDLTLGKLFKSLDVDWIQNMSFSSKVLFPFTFYQHIFDIIRCKHNEIHNICCRNPMPFSSSWNNLTMRCTRCTWNTFWFFWYAGWCSVQFAKFKCRMPYDGLSIIII